MSSNEIMTATPSRFGLPTYGRISGAAASVQPGSHLEQADETAFRCVDPTRVMGTVVPAAGTTKAAVVSINGTPKGDFLGTSAWRPPIC